MHCCMGRCAFAQDQGAFVQDQEAFVQDQEAFAQDQEAFDLVLVAFQVLEYLDVTTIQVMEDLDFLLLLPDFRLTQFHVWGCGALLEAFDLVDLEGLEASYQVLPDLQANQVLGDLGAYVLDLEVPFEGVYFETLVLDLPWAWVTAEIAVA